MGMNTAVFIFILCIFGILACNPTKKVKIKECAVFRKDSIKLDIYVEKQFTPTLRSSITYTKEGYFIQLGKKCILFYNNEGKLTDSVFVNFPSYSFYTWFASDVNHIYFLDEKKNTLTLISKKGIQKVWDLNSLPESFHSEFFILGNPPEVKQDTLFSFYLPKKFEEVNKYYKSSGDMSIKLLDSNCVIVKQNNPFPAIYTQKKGYYSDIAFRVINQSNLVYSFNHCDTLFVYNRNSNTIKTYSLKSPFFTLPPAKDEKNKTSEYRSKYATESSIYWRLYFDPFKNLYYRIVLHKEKYHNTDGTVTPAHQKAWSLQVINQQFELLYEIKFPSKKYDFNSLLVTSKGICIAPFKQYSGYLTYEVFSIK
jgi:hypothetical protein